MAKHRDKSGVHDEAKASCSLSHLWGFKLKIEYLSLSLCFDSIAAEICFRFLWG